MHKYWSKKPYEIIAALIERHSQPGDLILDPFCGSGVAPIEAVRLKRRAIGIDINPMAIRQTVAGLRHIEIEALYTQFHLLQQQVEPLIRPFYETTCPTCYDNAAFTTHTIWSNEQFVEARIYCPSCQKLQKIHQQPIDFRSTPLSPKKGPQGILRQNSRLNLTEDTLTCDLFTPRNQYSLSVLLTAIQAIPDPLLKETFELCFTGCLSQASRLVVVIRNRGGKAHPAQVGSWSAGFWLPQEYFEIYPWRCFESRFKRIVAGQEDIQHHIPRVPSCSSFKQLEGAEAGYWITLGNAAQLNDIPDHSIDYIITDPPHGNRIPYLELSHLWNDWLNIQPDWENEVVVSEAPSREKNLVDYQMRLFKVCHEMYRVLRPGKCSSIIFNARDFLTWEILLKGLDAAGFLLVAAESIHYSTGSLAQDTRANALTYDLALTCRAAGNYNEDHIASTVALKNWMEVLLSEKKGILTHELLLRVLKKAQQSRQEISIDLFLTSLKEVAYYQRKKWYLKSEYLNTSS